MLGNAIAAAAAADDDDRISAFLGKTSFVNRPCCCCDCRLAKASLQIQITPRNPYSTLAAMADARSTSRQASSVCALEQTIPTQSFPVCSSDSPDCRYPRTHDTSFPDHTCSP